MGIDSIAWIAGIASTAIFAASALPMLVKAHRTRDLTSYSLGNIGLANLGNLVHSAYVFSLPPGPLWLLHSFYLVSSATMLVWFLRYGRSHADGATYPSAPDTEMRRSPDAQGGVAFLAC